MLDDRDYPELSAAFVAAHPLDDPRFEPWLEAWYGAPVQRWYDDREPPDHVYWPDEATFAYFIARSWSMGRSLAERFSPDQIGQTVRRFAWFFRWADSSHDRLMFDAVQTLFREVFEPLVDDTLCHLSEPNTELEAALYMFWEDVGWGSPGGSQVGRTELSKLIERLLASPKASVQESALHGTGEFTPWDGEGQGDLPELAHLAREFIATGKTSRSELFEYADKAARGMVQ